MNRADRRRWTSAAVYAQGMTYYEPAYHTPPPYDQYEENPGTALGLVAFACSLFLWPVGLVLSLMSRTQSRHRGRKMTGLAQAALILSLVAAFFSILLTVAWFAFRDSAGTHIEVVPHQTAITHTVIQRG